MHSEKRLWVHQHHLHRRKDAVQQPLPPSLLSGFAIASLDQMQFNNLIGFQNLLDYHIRRSHRSLRFAHNFLTKKYSSLSRNPCPPWLLSGFTTDNCFNVKLAKISTCCKRTLNPTPWERFQFRMDLSRTLQSLL